MWPLGGRSWRRNTGCNVADKVKKCKLAGKGYQCLLPAGHIGKCDPVRSGWGRFWDSFGEAVGEALFGGHR